jgi:hypothetical protein
MKLQKALKNISLAVRVSFYSGCMAFTFKDNVGYIARVDGQSMQVNFVFVSFRIVRFVFVSFRHKFHRVTVKL